MRARRVVITSGLALAGFAAATSIAISGEPVEPDGLILATPKQIVDSGTTSHGVAWQAIAYRTTDRLVCVDIAVGQGAGGNCGHPTSLVSGYSHDHVNNVTVVSGTGPAAVDEIRIRLGDDTTVTTAPRALPATIAPSAQYFVVVIDDPALPVVDVAAYRGGVLLERHSFGPSEPGSSRWTWSQALTSRRAGHEALGTSLGPGP